MYCLSRKLIFNFLICDGLWRLSVTSDGLCWASGCLCLFTVVNSSFCGCILTSDGVQRFLMASSGFWWRLMASNGFCWLLLASCGLWWLLIHLMIFVVFRYSSVACDACEMNSETCADCYERGYSHSWNRNTSFFLMVVFLLRGQKHMFLLRNWSTFLMVARILQNGGGLYVTIGFYFVEDLACRRLLYRAR